MGWDGALGVCAGAHHLGAQNLGKSFIFLTVVCRLCERTSCRVLSVRYRGHCLAREFGQQFRAELTVRSFGFKASRISGSRDGGSKRVGSSGHLKDALQNCMRR